MRLNQKKKRKEKRQSWNQANVLRSAQKWDNSQRTRMQHESEKQSEEHFLQRNPSPVLSVLSTSKAAMCDELNTLKWIREREKEWETLLCPTNKENMCSFASIQTNFQISRQLRFTGRHEMNDKTECANMTSKGKASTVRYWSLMAKMCVRARVCACSCVLHACSRWCLGAAGKHDILTVCTHGARSSLRSGFLFQLKIR